MPSLIEDDQNQSTNSMPDLIDDTKFKDENRFKWMMNVAQNSSDLDQFMLAIDYGFAGPDKDDAYNGTSEDSDEHIMVKFFIHKAIKLDFADVFFYLDLKWDIETLECAIDNGSWRCATYFCRMNPDYVHDILGVMIKSEDFGRIYNFLSNVYISSMTKPSWDILIKKKEFHKILMDQRFKEAKREIVYMYAQDEDWEGLKKFVINYL